MSPRVAVVPIIDCLLATQCACQCFEALYHHVEAAGLWCRLHHATGPVFLQPRNITCPQPGLRGCFEIGWMRGHEHHFMRLTAKQSRCTEIGLGIRLVMTEQVRSEYCIPRKPCSFRHPHEQRDVPV